MSPRPPYDPAQPFRYAYGGDEFILVEIAEGMSVEASSRTVAFSRAVTETVEAGLIDVCPINSSVLFRYDPEVIAPADLMAALRRAEASSLQGQEGALRTRILEVPVWYDDPSVEPTRGMPRADRDAFDGTDVDYVAAVNGLSGAEEVIARHSGMPWLVTGVGFVAGLPWMYQLVPDELQLEAPKYPSPRTGSPRLGIGLGGCFCAINTSSNVTGYQMIGVVAPRISSTTGPDEMFGGSDHLFASGDIVKFRPVDGAECAEIRERVEAGEYRFRQAQVEFDERAWRADPSAESERLLEALRDADH